MSAESAATTLPVYVNRCGGSAPRVLEQLESSPGLRVHALDPEALKDAMKEAVAAGARRIAVCGGDGTLAMAAGLLAGTSTEMAVVPGGTLNHFAKRLNIPLDVAGALELARHGAARDTPFGRVNERLFLNTSSVGAYVAFVRTRERLERRLPYRLASIVAAARRIAHFRRVKLHIDGQPLRTPLVFVGVGERELRLPDLGQNKTQGQDGLHLIVLRCRTGREAFAIALQAMFRGADPLAREHRLEHEILEAVVVDAGTHPRRVRLALDGEIAKLRTPLSYSIHRQGLRVVQPTTEDPAP